MFVRSNCNSRGWQGYHAAWIAWCSALSMGYRGQLGVGEIEVCCGR
jgi:hypothetical protein